MKKVLLLMVAVLMVSSVAMADMITINTDASGSSCLLAPGFTTTTAILHKYSTGSTGDRFYLDTSAAGAGTSVFSFTTSWVTVGTIQTDLSVAYGVCLDTSTGPILLGTIVAQLVGPGSIAIKAAPIIGQIIYTDCSFGEHPASGGTAYIGTQTGPCEPIATQQSTWGAVKALYR